MAGMAEKTGVREFKFRPWPHGLWDAYRNYRKARVPRLTAMWAALYVTTGINWFWPE